MKQLLGLLGFLLGLSVCFGQFEIDALADLGDRPDTVLTRYDMVEFLSLGTCEQCLLPSQEQITTYDQARWDELNNIPGNNFDDIIVGETLYNGVDYSICIASAAEKGWINGYPKDTSPFCPGRFCGANTLSYGEFAQTVVNMIGSDIYKNYTISRKSVQDRLGALQDTDPYLLQTVSESLDRCDTDTCTLTNTDELEVYITYCRRHLDECQMLSTDVLDQGEYPIALTNILIQEGLVSRDQILDLGRYDQVPHGLFETILNQLISQKSCTWTVDHDYDGVKNGVDNCPVDYNPNQSDLDNDGIGDVCDDDIDGDGIPNPIGIIDDQGNIDHEKLKGSPGDEGEGNDLDTPDDGNASPRSFDIFVDPNSGFVSTVFEFGTEVTGEYTDIQRSFGDGKQDIGETVSHIYSASGLYIPKAVITWADGSKSVAKIPLEVQGGEDLSIAFVATADPLAGKSPLEVLLSHQYIGDVDQVVRDIYDSTDTVIQNTTVNAGADTGVVLTIPGVYQARANAYQEDTLVGIAGVSIEVGGEENTNRGAILVADPLVIDEGATTTFSTFATGFDSTDVSRVIRDFGDETRLEGDSLTTTKRYVTAGPYVVTQTIEFVDGHEPLIQIITIYVRPSEQNLPRSSELLIDKSVADIGEAFVATLVPTNFSPGEITKIIWTRGDGTKRINEDINSSTFLEDAHAYRRAGIRRLQAILVTNNGQQRVHETPLQVIGEDVCLENIGNCDLDGDGIIDQCDTDIDGDGVDNLIGIVIGENEECSFSKDVLNPDRLVEQLELIRNGAPYDNCMFGPNPDQADSDQDGFGDSCDSTDEPIEGDIPTPGQPGIGDRDGDGYPDNEDACPDIPEDFDGIEDKDGCPELPPIDVPDKSIIRPDECVQCPCPKADYVSEVVPGDRVKAVLVDPSGEIIYSQTAPRVVRDQ